MATRTCDDCGKVFTQGYCIDNGEAYYCQDCHTNRYTAEEWEEMYADGEGDSYWSDWSEADEDDDDEAFDLDEVHAVLNARGGEEGQIIL